MGIERPTVIHSVHEDDEALRPRIDRFVVGLGEWLDALQDAHAKEAISEVRELAVEHGRLAGELGYPGLVEAAADLEASCVAGDAEAARKTIAELTELVVRVRRGHRSAA